MNERKTEREGKTGETRTKKNVSNRKQSNSLVVYARDLPFLLKNKVHMDDVHLRTRSTQLVGVSSYPPLCVVSFSPHFPLSVSSRCVDCFSGQNRVAKPGFFVRETVTLRLAALSIFLREREETAPEFSSCPHTVFLPHAHRAFCPTRLITSK